MASKRPCDSASNVVTKKPKLYCHFKSSWRTQEFSVPVRDRPGAQRTVSVSGDILSGVDGGDDAKCKLCGITFSVRHGGANNVVKHFSSKKHLQAMSSSSCTQPLDKFGQSEVARRARQRQQEEELQFLKAEALFVQFVAEHNLPFHTGDHFTKLVKHVSGLKHCKTFPLLSYQNIHPSAIW